VSKLVVLEYVSLDGVIQAPGHAGEDPTGGFEHGGWTGPYLRDHRRYVAESFCAADAFLLGRLTYEIFADYWPTVTDADDEIAHALNTRPKYVASRSLTDPSWDGTTVLGADVAAEVAKLKAQPGRELLVVGSSELAQTLMAHGLVDEYRLMVHPVVLGGGKKLFRDGAAIPMHLVDVRASTSGLVLLTYRPDTQASHVGQPNGSTAGG
jgi:dihydrofolate reductase